MKCLFFVCLLFVTACVANGQSATSSGWDWFRQVSGSGEEAHAHFIIATNDGGFIQVGETGFVPNSAKLLVVKVNASGDLVWRKEFGSPGHNLGNSVIETSDAYWVAGALDHDSVLIKLNKRNGATIDRYRFDLGGSDAFEHLVEHSGGFVAVGYRNAQDREGTFHVEGQGVIVRIDSNGAIHKSVRVGNQLAQAYRISNHSGDLFVAGQTRDARDFGLMRLSPNLETRWFRTYGGRGENHNFAFTQGPDGSLYLSGHTTSGVQNWDTYTIKVSTSGQLLWERTQGNPRGFNPRYIHDEVWDIAVDSRGRVYVVAGTGDEYSYSQCNDNGCSDVWRVYLLEYDASGNLRSERVFGDDDRGDWAGEALTLTSDGGIVIAVDSGQFGFLKVSLR